MLAYLAGGLAGLRWALLRSSAGHGDGLLLAVPSLALLNAALLLPEARRSAGHLHVERDGAEEAALPFVLITGLLYCAMAVASACAERGWRGLAEGLLVTGFNALLFGGFLVVVVVRLYALAEAVLPRPRGKTVARSAGLTTTLLCLLYAICPEAFPWLGEGVANWFSWLLGHFR